MHSVLLRRRTPRFRPFTMADFRRLSDRAGGANGFVYASPPERILSIVNDAADTLASPNRSASPHEVFMATLEEAFQWPALPGTPILLNESNCRLFIQAVLPAPTKGTALAGLVVWVSVDEATLTILGQQMAGEPEHRRSLAAGSGKATPRGVIASLVTTAREPLGLWTHVKLAAPHEPALRALGLPVIAATDERFTPFPGLTAWWMTYCRTAVDSPAGAPNLLRSAAERWMPFIEGQKLVDALDQEKEPFETLYKRVELNAPALMLLGRLSETRGAIEQAKRCYHQAQLLDHPDGYAGELRCLSKLSKGFRDRHPHALDAIASGNRLSALTELRYALPEDPQSAAPILAYCLRGTRESAEGLRVSNTALSYDPDQPDVLGHKWSYLTELCQDAEALACAQDHLIRYPTDPVAVVNCIDSFLLTGNAPAAVAIVERYAILTGSPERALKQRFKIFETLQAWAELGEICDATMSLCIHPTVDTLRLSAETYTELGMAESALTLLEQAIAIDPRNSDVALSYGRTLARAGKEAEAKDFLCAVLADESRCDTNANRLFLVTLLSEIQRRTGEVQNAADAFRQYLYTDTPAQLLLASTTIAGPQPALEWAEVLIASDDIDSAKTVITELSGLCPHDPDVCHLYGLLQSV